MPLPYIGNPDYRGYLNYLAHNGDTQAQGVLGFVGNDGVLDPGKINRIGSGRAAQQLIGANQKYISAFNTANTTDTNNTTTTAPAGGPTYAPLNQGAVDNTQITIDQLPALLQAALAAESTTHDNSVKTFDQQEQDQRKAYTGSTTTNQQNYDSSFMDSIRAGIKGLGGLISLLRGTGASGGTADQLAHDTVAGTTADDIRTGADTQKSNQSALDTSLGSFLTDLHGKRQANEDTFANNEAAIKRDNATQLQDLYGKMAGYYGDAGDTGTANTFLSRAGALTPEIAAESKTQVSPYDTTPIVVHAPNLTAFSAPSQPDVATAPQDGQVGSGIFSISNTKRKDTNSTPVLAAAGA